jgi:hypothetical protein
VGTVPGFTGEEVVSMNCWGFTPELFPLLNAEFVAFLREGGTELVREFYLPAAVSELVRRSAVSVHVLPTCANWFGVTYREDRPRVAAAIAALVASGRYASPQASS